MYRFDVPSKIFVRCLCLFTFLPFALNLSAQHSTNNPPTQAELGMKKFQVAPDLKIDLFAAEPMLQNPVSFSIDEHGRFFIAETHRYGISIFDITQNPPWLLDDLSFRTVADRSAFLTKTFATNEDILTRDSELIRLVEDRAGTGHADTSAIFAADFNQVPSGVAAGILARRGNIWAGCIPDLWHFTGPDNSGKAESREKLQSGFGIHIGVTGHDLHGFRLGPDGKLYMSSGDRGFVFKTKEGKHLNYPDTGGVLRCNPDGSELEVVCIGLRNPQELAFDQYGNLFTDDNDTAGEDRSRVIYVVEGADYGWRCSYQHMSGFGPWNKERVWLGNIDDALPWSGYVSQGPSGLTFYPGTGLPDKYLNHFLVCDFPGGVRSFAVQPKGASYETIDNEKFLWNLWPTDVDFGPDSCVYISDWVEGWQMPNKGRLYRLYDPTQTNNPVLAEVKKLLGEGMEKKSLVELVSLLAHSDMRVRLEAQYAMAEMGSGAIPMLTKVAQDHQNQLARLHAIWGLGQVGRKLPTAFAPLIPLLSDSDGEVRAQAAKVLGAGRYAPAFDELVYLLSGPHLPDDHRPLAAAQSALYSLPRPRFFAATALGQLKNKKAIGPILEMLRNNNDQDAYLRHAGMMALLGIGDQAAIELATKDDSSAIRHAALLCLRRLESPQIARFLHDAKPSLVVAAARAINDVPINDALPELAAMLKPRHAALWQPEIIQQQWAADAKVGKSIHSETGWRHTLAYEQLLLRAINANFRLGQAANAKVVADFASRADSPPAMRIAALEALSDWAKPAPIDRLMGLWRPLPPRNIAVAQTAVQPHLAGLLHSTDEQVLIVAIKCAGRLDLGESAPPLLDLFQRSERSSGVRVAALQALADLKAGRFATAEELALADTNPSIRREGIKLITSLEPPNAPALLEKFLATEIDLRMSQTALTTLGELKNPKADRVIEHWLEQLAAARLQPELQLDLLEAAAKRTDSGVMAALRKYADTLPADDELKGYREALVGGDAEEGKKVFTERAGVECLRCHAIAGKGGVVGPDLAGIGKRQTREYLLESILLPNKQLAPGFENVTLTLKNGNSLAGLVKREDDKELLLISPDDGPATVAKDQIQTRQRGLSAMPEGLAKMLSKTDLRNLVEYLTGLK
ncbi:MAG: Heme-binding protein [Pedosphaera sp.]|nr:Heme-binding protein [Pedosphaera sp.]